MSKVWRIMFIEFIELIALDRNPINRVTAPAAIS